MGSKRRRFCLCTGHSLACGAAVSALANSRRANDVLLISTSTTGPADQKVSSAENGEKVNHIVKRVAKATGVLALIAVAGLAGLLAALWVDHGRSTPLPPPSGPYKVGRTTNIW